MKTHRHRNEGMMKTVLPHKIYEQHEEYTNKYYVKLIYSLYFFYITCYCLKV